MRSARPLIFQFRFFRRRGFWLGLVFFALPAFGVHWVEIDSSNRGICQVDPRNASVCFLTFANASSYCSGQGKHLATEEEIKNLKFSYGPSGTRPHLGEVLWVNENPAGRVVIRGRRIDQSGEAWFSCDLSNACLRPIDSLKLHLPFVCI